MNNETTEILLIASALLGVIALGVLMVWASRWSRNKNEVLNKGKRTTQTESTQKALNEGKLPFAKKGFWVGDLSIVQTVAGKALAIFAIVVVSVFLIFACYAVMKVI